MGNDCSKLLQQTIFINIANKAMKHINEGIMVTDREGSIIWVNPAFEIVTGYHQEEIIGQNPRFLQSGLHDKAFYKSMWKEIIENGVWKGEIWNKRKDGELFLEWLTVISIRDRKGNITNYLAIFPILLYKKEILNS